MLVYVQGAVRRPGWAITIVSGITTPIQGQRLAWSLRLRRPSGSGAG